MSDATAATPQPCGQKVSPTFERGGEQEVIGRCPEGHKTTKVRPELPITFGPCQNKPSAPAGS